MTVFPVSLQDAWRCPCCSVNATPPCTPNCLFNLESIFCLKVWKMLFIYCLQQLKFAINKLSFSSITRQQRFMEQKKRHALQMLGLYFARPHPLPPFNVLLCLASFEYIILCMRLLHPIWRYSTPMQSICAYYCVIMCICIKLCVLLHQMCCTIFYCFIAHEQYFLCVTRARSHTRTHASAFHFNFNALLSPHKHKFLPYTNTYYIFQ